jgi:hypothetical protein
MTMQVELLKVEVLYNRGQLHAAVGGPAHLRAARADLRRLRSIHKPGPQAWADILQASILLASGDRQGALEVLPIAIASNARAEMRGHAAALRLCHGRLRQGDIGAALERRGAQELRRSGVSDPERFTRILAAGLLSPGRS